MCFCLYLAARAELPLVPETGRIGDGKISIGLLSEGQQAVCARFSLPHVFEVGSDAGCGCNFRHNEGEL